MSAPGETDLDPLGLFPTLSEQLQQTYYAQLRAFQRKFDLVRFEPAARQRIRAAETPPGGPATFLVALTVHPRDASGFPRLIGRLPTPFEAPQADEPPDAAEEGKYIRGLFGRQNSCQPTQAGAAKQGPSSISGLTFGSQQARLMDWQTWPECHRWAAEFAASHFAATDARVARDVAGPAAGCALGSRRTLRGTHPC
jgi:hypothetical protein